jgi:DMSO/TMAO reductase YedYZ molybdopterin-dependent catalytic subunit
MTNKRITVVSLAVTILLALAGCAQQAATSSGATTPAVTLTMSTTVDVVSQATLSRYRENEVREYQGVRLDPAIGPRDNSISGVQTVDLSSYRLTIDGLVDQPTVLLYDEVLARTAVERRITLYCVEGWEATVLWRGVQLSDLISLVGVKQEANTVIFHCVDDYTTSLPLQTIIEKELILAYDANGLPLPPEMGFPFIVVAEDKLGYKWARWVVRIELSADESYKGFWESRGFDNEADLD